jgi:hypothetical protein
MVRDTGLAVAVAVALLTGTHPKTLLQVPVEMVCQVLLLFTTRKV